MEKHGFTHLKDLKVNGNQITSAGATALFDTLKRLNADIKKIRMDSNPLDDECMKSIADYLQYDQSLVILGLASSNFSDKGIQTLCEGLAGNVTLKNLDLSYARQITPASLPYFAELAKVTVIETIALPRGSISYRDITNTAKLFSKPIEERELPIRSSTKSAAKVS